MSDKVKVYTVSEFAAACRVDEPTGRGLMTFLRAKNVVKEVGTRPNPTGRGKGATLYEVDWLEVVNCLSRCP